jgi:pimeloyl-ACP methyl ester carboxylesterase
MIMVLLVLAVLGILFLWYGPAPMGASGGQSINVLEQVELGGAKQWISIRGTDVRNPVLLFLHGGPGSANLAKLRIQAPGLEKEFVVVNWDQRGAGKSFSFRMDEDPWTTDQLRKDTHQLVGFLRQRFGVEKVYLMGFSWGTVLGLWNVQDHPEDFQAFISVSQVVNIPEGEKLSLEYVRQQARDTRNTDAIRELAGIDPAYQTPDWYSQLARERKWLLAFGGVYHTARGYTHEILMLLKAREYSLIDVAVWPFGSSRSLQKLWPEIMDLDFNLSCPQVDVPVYFMAGRYDYNAPSALTEAYFRRLRAPKGKQLIWFENSAHDIFYDEPEKLTEAILALKNA